MSYSESILAGISWLVVMPHIPYHLWFLSGLITVVKPRVKTRDPLQTFRLCFGCLASPGLFVLGNLLSFREETMATSFPLVSGSTHLSGQHWIWELNETEWTGNSFSLWQLPPGLQFLHQNWLKGESLVIFPSCFVLRLVSKPPQRSSWPT